MASFETAVRADSAGILLPLILLMVVFGCSGQSNRAGRYLVTFRACNDFRRVPSMRGERFPSRSAKVDISAAVDRSSRESLSQTVRSQPVTSETFLFLTLWEIPAIDLFWHMRCC